jgi:hypothetical protein
MNSFQSSLLALLLDLPCCSLTSVVHEVNPTSECAKLRTSYPSNYGLLLFSDATAASRSIPWCFPATSGFGVQAYTVQISVSRPGVLSIVLSDIRPPTQFAVQSIAGACAADNTGKSYVGHGSGTHWSLPVEPGNYCLTMISGNPAQDVWFTLTATRP